MFTNLRIRMVSKLLSTDTADQPDIDIIDNFINQLNIQYHIADADLKNIPTSGPYIVVANHPFGFIDSLILLSIFGKNNPDFKVLARLRHKELKSLSPLFIQPGDNLSKGEISSEALAEIDTRLKEERSLALFADCLTTKTNDPKDQHTTVLNEVIKSGIPVLPVYFYGSNNLTSRLLNMLPQSLRAWVMPDDAVQSAPSAIRLRIGKPITSEDLHSFDNQERAARFLKAYLVALGSQVGIKKIFKLNAIRPKKAEPVIEPVAVEELEAELEVIRQNGGMLQSKNNYEIYLGKTETMPNILRELGRLRELTFREVGEGTLQSIDIDEYDIYYNHLFVWDREEKCIIGAYRLGRGDKILSQHGTRGFYVTSLFKLEEPLHPVLEKTLELGRSFVVKKYQQKPLPLFLLWQGILCFLRDHKQYQYLMGPVSISNDFSVFSKDLLIAFIRKNYFNPHLAQYVQPHQEFVVQTDPMDIDVVLERSNDLVRLDKFISSIEPNFLKVPVLLKQYIRQNAKIIAFNVDPLFNNCLDGLMILDLNDVPPETLEMLQSR